MARKRMFSKKITESDVFCDMPLSAQALYFHICMEADDDGFVGGVKGIRRRVGASEDDFKLLVAKRFLLPFESGVVVVRQWLVHNTLRADRYTPTEYTREASLLVIQRSGPEKGAYEVALSPLEQAAGTLTPSDGTLTGENVTGALNGNQTATNGIPMVAVRLRYRDRLRDNTYSDLSTDNPIDDLTEEEDIYDNNISREARARGRAGAREEKPLEPLHERLRREDPATAASFLSMVDGSQVIKKLYGNQLRLILDAVRAGRYPLALVNHAIDKTWERNKRWKLDSPAAYTFKLLDDWAEQGFETAEDVQEAKDDWFHYS